MGTLGILTILTFLMYFARVLRACTSLWYFISQVGRVSSLHQEQVGVHDDSFDLIKRITRHGYAELKGLKGHGRGQEQGQGQGMALGSFLGQGQKQGQKEGQGQGQGQGQEHEQDHAKGHRDRGDRHVKWPQYLESSAQ